MTAPTKMRANLLLMTAALVLLGGMSVGVGQSPQGKGSKGKGSPPDLQAEIIKQLREAYKAPLEVPQDVMDDLRASYKPGANSRENSIMQDLRRLYGMSEAQEATVVRELRNAIAKPAPENERRFFDEVGKLPKLPLGTVPAKTQLSQVIKTFERFDEDGNGKLSVDEMPEDLKNRRGRFDANRDGVIGPEEYWAYYQERLRSITEDVANGKIDLGLKRGGPVLQPEEEKRPLMFRAGKLPKSLPPWFSKLDLDEDGQVSLFEWRRGGKSLKEFADADHNADGLVTAEETLRYLVFLESAANAAAAEAASSTLSNASKKGKKKK